MLTATQQPNSRAAALNLVRGLGGAALGAVSGYFLFFWLSRHGLYALAVPGAMLGLGCGLLVRTRSVPLAVFCGLAALALGIVTRWRYATWIKDDSFGYFLAHLFDLGVATLALIGLGAGLGSWFALGFRRRS